MAPFVPGARVSDLSQGVVLNWQGGARKNSEKGLENKRLKGTNGTLKATLFPDREPIPLPSGKPGAPRTCRVRAPLPFSLCQIWKPRREIRNLTPICPITRLTRSNPTRLHLAFRSFTPRAFALSHISRASVFPSRFFSDADKAPSPSFSSSLCLPCKNLLDLPPISPLSHVLAIPPFPPQSMFFFRAIAHPLQTPGSSARPLASANPLGRLSSLALLLCFCNTSSFCSAPLPPCSAPPCPSVSSASLGRFLGKVNGSPAELRAKG